MAKGKIKFHKPTGFYDITTAFGKMFRVSSREKALGILTASRRLKRKKSGI